MYGIRWACYFVWCYFTFDEKKIFSNFVYHYYYFVCLSSYHTVFFVHYSIHKLSAFFHVSYMRFNTILINGVVSRNKNDLRTSASLSFSRWFADDTHMYWGSNFSVWISGWDKIANFIIVISCIFYKKNTLSCIEISLYFHIV